MSHINLQCSECAAKCAADMTTLQCIECGSALDTAYAPSAQNGHDHAAPSPLHFPDNAVTLGEGGTPVVRLHNLGGQLGIQHLYAKLEFMNPTGSFKDRGAAVMMSVAKELGVSEVVEDSSGNAGASVAAYAARAGIRARIFAPANAPTAKLDQIAVYGAPTHLIDGNRQAVTDAAIDFASRNSLVYASHNLSPYFIEGTKTFAYEIVEQFGADPPQNIVTPVGNGSLFIGAHKGFRELQQGGRLSDIPTMHAVQARAVMPLVAAFTGASNTATSGGTVAGGIAVSNPPRIRQALQVLRDTGGSAVAVDEADILRWHSLLAEREGIFVEPTSAAAFAGMEALITNGIIRQSESVLVAVTGFGLKDAIPQNI